MCNKEKYVAILTEDLYQVLEVWYPFLRLKEAGISVKVVGTGTKAVYGSKEGYPVKADLAAADVDAQEVCAVIIPGGYAPDILRRYPAVVELVKNVHTNGNVVAAICHGGCVLVSADIIRGRQVTCFSAIKDDLIAAGGHYCDQTVAVDKNLITSRKPEDLPYFVEEIIKQLKK